MAFRQRLPCKFQFTPLREGRRVSFSCLLWLSISIHAPPRGATLVFWTVSSTTIFQFTPLREGRRQRNGAAAGRRIFQFTPLREGRHGDTPRHCIRFQFQFTPLREGRPSKVVPSQEEEKFQFTPLREGRRERAEFAEFARPISIHAPPRGATRLRMAGRTGEKFQFTPLREGRPFRPCDQPCATAFQFTPLREGRRLCLPR